MVTGMYIDYDDLKSPEEKEREKALKDASREDRKVTVYFKKLGYDVTWDQSFRRGEIWHEIMTKDNQLVCQVDKGVPLENIREDMIAWYNGKRGSSKTDYQINGSKKDPLFKELLAKVVEIKP